MRCGELTQTNLSPPCLTLWAPCQTATCLVVTYPRAPCVVNLKEMRHTATATQIVASALSQVFYLYNGRLSCYFNVINLTKVKLLKYIHIIFSSILSWFIGLNSVMSSSRNSCLSPLSVLSSVSSGSSASSGRTSLRLVLFVMKILNFIYLFGGNVHTYPQCTLIFYILVTLLSALPSTLFSSLCAINPFFYPVYI